MQIRLRNILMERGINVKTMADALGVDVTSIPIYNRFAPSMDSMKRMADWLQVPTWELFCDCGRSSWAAFQQVVTEPLMERFARRLKELARERHLQLSVVAERAGMSKANLSLSMKRNITTSTIEKIARALEIEDKAYLLFITPSEYDAIYRAAATGASADASGTVAGGACFGTLQPVRPTVEAEPEEPVLNQDAQDLFAQYPDGMTPDEMYQMELMQIEEEERRKNEGAKPVVQMQEGVTYVCGNTMITITNGEMEIKVKR